MTLQAGGTSGARDYYGADSSWFSGGSFTRPKFDLNFAVPSGNMVIQSGSNGFVDFDNLEIAHQGVAGVCAASCSSGSGTPYGTQAAFQLNGSSSITVKNSYIHDWITTQTGGCAQFLNYSAGSIFGAQLVANTEISGEGSWYTPSHLPLTFGGAIEQSPGTTGTEVRNSKIHGTMAAMFSIRLVHDNEIYHVSSEHSALDSCPHSQVIEDDDGRADVIYNNAIHDNQGRGGQNVGVVIYECAQSSIYNNVMWNNNAPGYNGNILLSGDPSIYGCSTQSSGSVANVYNNTIDCSNGVSCFSTDSKGTVPGTVNLKNNIFITNGNPISLPSGITSFNNGNNYTMPTSEASTYGFTSARKYAPSSANPHVSGGAFNLLSVATGILAPLAYDTAGAPWYGGSYTPRTTTSDLGAFVFGAQSSSSKPNPPSNLAANVQ